MKDAKSSIASAVKSGRVFIGIKSTIKAMVAGKVSAVFISSDCPRRIRSRIEGYAQAKSIPINDFPGNSRDMSTVCRKPFNITVISVVGEDEDKA